MEDKLPEELPDVGVDVFDGPETMKADTNPFIAMPNETIEPGPSSVNPFECYLEESFDDSSDKCEGAVGGKIAFEEVSLNKGMTITFNTNWSM